jgi:hypothetical protein
MIEKLKNGKEEAEFSKSWQRSGAMRRSTLSLPEKEWRESIHPRKVEDILSRFEFRSLVGRVKSLVEGIKEDNVAEERIAGDELFDDLLGADP